MTAGLVRIGLRLVRVLWFAARAGVPDDGRIGRFGSGLGAAACAVVSPRAALWARA